MRYGLRTLLLLLAVGPLSLAATWLGVVWFLNAVREDMVLWEYFLAATAVVCAIPYGGGIAILLWNNPRRTEALIIAAFAVLLWPCLLFGSIAQLLFVVPLFTVFVSHGTDLSKPLSSRTIGLAIGLTVALILAMAGIGMFIDAGW